MPTTDPTTTTNVAPLSVDNNRYFTDPVTKELSTASTGNATVPQSNCLDAQRQSHETATSLDELGSHYSTDDNEQFHPANDILEVDDTLVDFIINEQPLLVEQNDPTILRDSPVPALPTYSPNEDNLGQAINPEATAVRDLNNQQAAQQMPQQPKQQKQNSQRQPGSPASTTTTSNQNGVPVDPNNPQAKVKPKKVLGNYTLTKTLG